MNLVPSVAAAYEQMARERGGGAPITNFYPTQEKVQRWIDERTLYAVTAGKVRFLLRRDHDFFHVSYVASQVADLAPAVRELFAMTCDILMVDVIGKPTQISALETLFVDAGFTPHCRFQRMTRGGGPAANASSEAADADDAEVGYAEAADGVALAALLEGTLDRYAEQIPGAGEMSRAAAQSQILIVRAGNDIAGMLFYEVTGVSSLLRYWVVNSAYRDRRVGGRLMRRYLADCKDVKRFVLWSMNDNAIKRYRHYGYETDGLVDQVLMRRAL